MDIQIKSKSIEAKGLYKGEIILKRYNSPEGIYCIEFYPIGKIPMGIHKKVMDKYYECKDKKLTKYKLLNGWCDQNKIVLECRREDAEQLYNFVQMTLISNK